MRVGAISISEEEFRKLNAFKHAVGVPPKLGGGFMALLEFVHQVHPKEFHEHLGIAPHR